MEYSFNDISLYAVSVRLGQLCLDPIEFERVKKSTTYRLMCILSGECKLFLSGATYRLEKNDICFLRPGDIYRTIPVKNMFLVNIYFAFNHDEYQIFKNVNDIDNIELIEECRFIDCELLNHSFVVKNFALGVNTAHEMLAEADNTSSFSYKRQNALLTQLTIDLVRRQENKHKSDELSDVALQVIAYIKNNISEKLTCRDIAEKYNYHPNYLNHIMSSVLKMPLHQYILEQKIESATGELINTDKSIAEIAQDYSFYDSSHFLRCYFKVTGIRPSDVRAAAREK